MSEAGKVITQLTHTLTNETSINSQPLNRDQFSNIQKMPISQKTTFNLNVSTIRSLQNSPTRVPSLISTTVNEPVVLLVHFHHSF